MSYVFSVIKVDDFTRNLWHIYESVRSEGVAQPLSIAILRNDFMLDKNKEGLEVSLSQIEINTVSISFGASTTQMTKLHRNMLHYTNNQHFIPKVAYFLRFIITFRNQKLNIASFLNRL